jgi:hypothetical protein
LPRSILHSINGSEPLPHTLEIYITTMYPD